MVQLIELIKVFKHMRSQSTTNGAKRKAKKLSLSLFPLIINPANKNSCAVWGYPLFGA